MRSGLSFVALIAVAAIWTGIAIAGSAPVSKTHKIGAPSNGICPTPPGPRRQCGTITLTAAGGKTQVVIEIKNEPAGAIEPSHIHKGACGHPGAVVWPLTDVVAGHSTTVVNAPISKVDVAGDSVNIHQSAAQLNKYTACGNLATAMHM
jgi:hypothetical protein